MIIQLLVDAQKLPSTLVAGQYRSISTDTNTTRVKVMHIARQIIYLIQSSIGFVLISPSHNILIIQKVYLPKLIST
jgi:hypothetical protein